MNPGAFLYHYAEYFRKKSKHLFPIMEIGVPSLWLDREIFENPNSKCFKNHCPANGWDGWIRTSEMPESKSGALPLGYTPITTFRIILFINRYVKNFYDYYLK